MARPPQRKITTDAIAAWGSVFDTSVTNVALVAQKLKASPESVRRVMAEAAASFRDMTVEQFTGPAAKAVDTASPLGMLQAAFGRGPRGGPVNASAAAKALGVSPGTVRRWAAGTQQPSPDRLAGLKKAARNAARRISRRTKTAAGRRRITAAYRTSPRGRKATSGDTTVWVTGWQGPSGYAHERNRTVRMTVGPDDIDELLAQYEQGGDEALREWLTAHYDNTVPEWEFYTIDAWGIGEPE